VRQGQVLRGLLSKMVDEIKQAEVKEIKQEEKIVETAVEKVEEGKETVKEAEKEVAEKIEVASEKLEDKKEDIKEKAEDKKENKKVVNVGSGKKEAVVNGRSVPISTKQAIAICNYIKGKNVDKAISELELAEKMRKPIPMRGEIPHKKGIMSGRYLVNASGEMIRLLRSVKANAIADNLELEKLKVHGMANVASRPARRGGRTKFKRTHVQIKLIPISKVGVKK